MNSVLRDLTSFVRDHFSYAVPIGLTKAGSLLLLSLMLLLYPEYAEVFSFTSLSIGWLTYALLM